MAHPSGGHKSQAAVTIKQFLHLNAFTRSDAPVFYLFIYSFILF